MSISLKIVYMPIPKKVGGYAQFPHLLIPAEERVASIQTTQAFQPLLIPEVKENIKK
jgi:hypothetical protein